MRRVPLYILKQIVADAGKNRAEGARRLNQFLFEGLEKKKFRFEDLSLKDIGFALGCLDGENLESSFAKLIRQVPKAEEGQQLSIESVLGIEDAYAVTSHAFHVISNTLLASKVIEAYEAAGATIGQELVTVVPSRMRYQNIPGMRGMGGLSEVDEGHPYETTGFGEKWVQAAEYKFGKILAVTKEALLFDQTGLIARQAATLGERAREQHEEHRVKAVIDSLTDRYGNKRYVYRPQGTPSDVYKTDGSNYNYVGVGNTTTAAFNAAVPLATWEDVDKVLLYRSTEVLDDRVDGTSQPIPGLNNNVSLLVPSTLYTTAWYIKNQTEDRRGNASNRTQSIEGNPVAGQIQSVLKSSYLDQVSKADWYVGDFKKQYFETEIWPITLASQGTDSNVDFEQDISMRVKVSHYYGLNCVDTPYVTKVDGA